MDARQWRSHLVAMNPPTASNASPTPDELADLLEAVAQRADRVAFAGLFRHFAPRIKAYLIRGGTPPGQAEDLAQEAMVSLWRKAAQFDRRRAAASTWVFTIARHLRIDQLRRGEEMPLAEDESGETPDLPDEAPSALEQLARGRVEHDVRAAMARLPHDQREVLHLSFYEDRPHAAIAEALAIPLGTVKSRIRLAVAHLRQQLGHLTP